MKKLICISLLFVVLFICGCNKKTVDINTYDSEEFTSSENDDKPDKVQGVSANIAVVSKDAKNSEDSDKIKSEAGLLVDVTTGQVLFNKNVHKKEFPASTTKVLTALVALKYADQNTVRKIGSEVLINEENAVLCDFREGDMISFDILLHGSLMRSGNDAAAALALTAAGSISEFADKMNEEAKRIGATNSHFMNPHGLDQDGHYTTAYDLYLIFNEAIKNQKFVEAISCKEYSNSFNRTTAYGEYVIDCEYYNSNYFVTGNREYPSYINVLGGKAGYTDLAGRCYVMLAESGGHRYIFVTMNCATRDIMYDDLSYLLSLVPDMNSR